MPEYTFGECKICHKNKALKDGVCEECNRVQELPEGFEKIFGGFR